ncbi:hypothetical protein [Mycolicibacterium peregrinum]|uniref:hypothetical protein n=1 Tax=Mycolicibacterium peregrinum TaxID=43304 RepID=UPI0012FFCFA7|nr:hypothetical protein [Mycolicibacterium peregrinum]
MSMGLGRVTHALVGAEVMHKPSGALVTIEQVSPPSGVYVDFGKGPELHDAEDFRR